LLAVRTRPIVKGAWSWAPTALAAVLLVLIFLKAITAVDLVYDSLAYHLPFEALRVGLLTEWQFQRPFPNPLRGYYLGLPILADLLRGWMWKFSGRAEAVNLLGGISLLALAAYLKWAFRPLEVAWVLIGVMAIPAIQTAAAGNYDDIPANVACAIYLISMVDLWSNPDKFKRPARWIVLFLAAFAAANMKLQTSVFVCLALPFVVPPVWRLLHEQKAGWRRIAGTTLLGICGSLLIAVNLIKNLILYRNPLYPVDLEISGIHLVGPVTHDAYIIPGAYEHVPEAVRWLLSVLEYRSLDGRDIPYSNGMGNVPTTSISASMGGFFSALVVASICFLILCVSRRRDPLSLSVLGAFLVSTVVVALFPAANNLRYDSFWMILLVTGCLLLMQGPSLKPYLQCYKIVLFASLVFVTSVTGGIYFTPIWNPMQEYVDRSGTDELLRAVVEPGAVVCLEQVPGGEWDGRFTIIFAPIFHKALAQQSPYAVKEGSCIGYKEIHRKS